MGACNIQHCYAAVHHFHTVQRRDVGNGSASAHIDLSKLCCLEGHPAAVKHIAKLRQIFRVRVIAALFPQEPVYLFSTRPFPEICRRFSSQRKLHTGDHRQRLHRRKAFWNGLSSGADPAHYRAPAHSISSATVFSKKRDCIPVAPTLPISSLSTSRQQLVYFWGSASSIAARDV